MHEISNTYTSAWVHWEPCVYQKTCCELNYVLNFNESSMTVKAGWLRPVILAHTFSETISETSG